MTSKGVQIALGVGAVVGLTATVAITIYDTVKAVRAVDAKKIQLGVDKLDRRTLIRTAAPHYIRSGAIGLITGGLMAASGVTSVITQGTLSAGLASANRFTNLYRDKVRELHGDEEDLKIAESIQMEKMISAKNVPVTSASFGDDFNILPEDYTENEGEMLFHIGFYDKDDAGVYFTSTVPRVINAIYHFNRNAALGSDMRQSELLSFLGLEPTRYSEELSYSYMFDEGMAYLDFDISKKTDLPDGMVCRIITVACNPSVDTSKYY